MEISKRLKVVASLVEKCEVVADIGTDHAYVPIYLIDNEVCEKAIASDINKGPVYKALKNIKDNNQEEKIECRLGAGLKTIKPYEAKVAIIAGMGGNLIKEIIEEDLHIFNSLKYAVLQPVQNPDVLRRYLYNKGYDIIDEELVYDENKYYEIIKVKYGDKPKFINEINYEISELLIRKKHPLLKDYINYKIFRYEKIYSSIKEETESGTKRKEEVKEKIKNLKGIVKCL